MQFKADKITHKELTDGTIRLYIDTGEYEYDSVMSGLQDLRSEFGREEAIFEVTIKGKKTDQSSASSENKYKSLWSKIESLATMRGIDKDELEANLKEEWGIDSFTELSDEEREKLEQSIQQTLREDFDERLR